MARAGTLVQADEHDLMWPSFSDPLWLLALPPFLFLLYHFQRKSYIPARRSRHIFWFCVRAFLITLIVFALAGLRLSTSVRKNQVLFLVDRSDSIAPQQKEKALRLLNDSIRKIQSPDLAGVIVFGFQAEVERFPAAPHSLSSFETDVNATATNLEEALELADALMADDYQKNVVILSDGLETGGNASQAALSLKQKGVTLQAFYLEPTDSVDAQIDAVRAPAEMQLQEPFNLEVITRSNRDMPAILQVFRNGELLQEGSVKLKKSEKNLIRMPQKITDAGLYRFDVRLKPQEDTQAENNISQAWVSVKGPPRLLLVDEQPAELQPLADAFVRRGFQVVLKEGRYLPRTLQDMLLYHAILIRNVPASTIQAQMPVIQQYVHEFGGGFAMLGGTKSFGPGGYYQTPVETVLPVRMDLVNKKYLADVAMVIVIDKSGSMSYTDRGKQKIDLADEGGARVASLLKETDQLGVLAVDSVAKWAYQLQRLSKKSEAIDAITSVRAGGGGIYVYSGLKEAYSALAAVKSSVKHVILFADTADCEEKHGPGGESALELAAKALDQHQITTTTIGIGQSGDSDVSFLEQLATIASGRFYFTNDMFTLPQIFAQESAVVQRHYITEETFVPAIGRIEPLLSGLTEIPQLDGYVATTAKTFAAVSLTSHREDPVLAFWRHGLGHTIAYTSDPVGAWGSKWLSWANWERFWIQCARYLARTNEPADFQVSVDSHDINNTIIVVDTFDPEAHQESTWAGALIDANGQEHRLAFSRSSYGQFEARIPASGALFGKVFRLERDQIMEEAIVQFSAAPNREYEISDAGRQNLMRLTGGPLVDSVEQLRFTNKTATDHHPVRAQLILWAIWLFLLDVTARKLDFTTFRRSKALQPAPVTAAAPLQALKIRKTELNKHRPAMLELEEMVVVEETAPKHVPEPESDRMSRLKEAKKKLRH